LKDVTPFEWKLCIHSHATFEFKADHIVQVDEVGEEEVVVDSVDSTTDLQLK